MMTMTGVAGVAGLGDRHDGWRTRRHRPAARQAGHV